MGKTYYEVLGVASNASSDDIRQAYLRSVKELHPDRNKAKDATAQFQALVYAFSILYNEKERAQYDSTLSSPQPSTHISNPLLIKGAVDSNGLEYAYKVTLMGPDAKIKSQVIRAVDTTDPFDPGVTKISDGVVFKIFRASLDAASAKLYVIDTSGQERFRSVTRSYLRNSHVELVVLDERLKGSNEYARNLDYLRQRAQANDRNELCALQVLRITAEPGQDNDDLKEFKTLRPYPLTVAQDETPDISAVEAIFHIIAKDCHDRVMNAGKGPAPSIQSSHNPGLFQAPREKEQVEKPKSFFQKWFGS